MKILKNLSFLLVFALLTISSCKPSDDDPTPTQTNLDKVKATLVGTWTFKSVTVTQGSITATTFSGINECDKIELKNAGFSNDKWIDITPIANYTYLSDDRVNFSNNCISATANLTVTATQNIDNTVTLKFSNGDIYNVNINDITFSIIKATYLTFANSSGVGYSVIYQFER